MMLIAYLGVSDHTVGGPVSAMVLLPASALYVIIAVIVARLVP